MKNKILLIGLREANNFLLTLTSEISARLNALVYTLNQNLEATNGHESFDLIQNIETLQHQKIEHGEISLAPKTVNAINQQNFSLVLTAYYNGGNNQASNQNYPQFVFNNIHTLNCPLLTILATPGHFSLSNIGMLITKSFYQNLDNISFINQIVKDRDTKIHLLSVINKEQNNIDAISNIQDFAIKNSLAYFTSNTIYNDTVKDGVAIFVRRKTVDILSIPKETNNINSLVQLVQKHDFNRPYAVLIQ